MLPYGIRGQGYSLQLQNLTVEDGLSSRTIYTAFQDEAGFIWISTSYGLDRYDGSRFKHFSGQELGIKQHSDKLLEDFNHNIWLHYSRAESDGMDYDVVIFNPVLQKRSLLKDYLPYPLPFKSEDVTSISNTGGLNVLISTVNGAVYELDQNTVHLRHQQPNAEKIHHITHTSITGIWITTIENTIKLNRDWEPVRSFENSHIFINGFNETPANELVRSPLVTAEEDDLGRLSYGAFPTGISGKKLISARHYINDVIQDNPVPHSESALTALLPESPHQFWTIKSKSGKSTLNLVNPDGRVLASQAYPWSYSRPLFFDHQKNLWMATENSLVIASWKQSPFKQYLADHKSYYGVDYGVRGIVETQGHELLISGLGLTWLLDTRDGTKQSDLPLSLGFALEVENERVWMSFENSKVYDYDIHTGDLTIYRYKGWSTGLRNATASFPKQHWSLHVDVQGVLWTGHAKGLSYLDRQQEHLVPIVNKGKMAQLAGASVINIYETDKGLWLATTKGIYLFDPLNKSVIAHYHTEGVSGKQLPHNSFAHIYEDRDGIFWLASKGGGLVRWQPETGEYKQFTVKNGLSNNVLYAVYEDNHNNLWLPSDKGINQFNKLSLEVNHFLEQDGISHNEFNTISHYRGKDSTLYFGGLRGVNAFQPDEIVKSQITELTPVVITGLQKQSRKDGILKEHTADLLNDDLINLQPSELGFQLEFSHLDYRPKENKHYAYLLEGLDADWTYVNTNSLRINALPYGRHNLLLKARQSNGLWTNPISIPVTVNSPVYMKAWFLGLCLLVFLIFVYGIFHLRLKRLKKNEERLESKVRQRTKEAREQAEQLREQAIELKKLDEVKSQFFANISHELRTPLTLIMGPVDQMIKDKTLTNQQAVQLKRMYRNGHNLTNLVEEILELSKLQAGKLEIKEFPVRIKSLIGRLFSAYESIASRRGIIYTCHLNLDDELVLKIDVNKVEKVVNNLISNAIKFTSQGGFVKLTARVDIHHFHLSVEDSGKGISDRDLPFIFDRFFQTHEEDFGKVKGGTGIGLALVKELSEAIGGTINVESVRLKGTKFDLLLPKKETSSDTLVEPEFVDNILSHVPNVEISSKMVTHEFSVLLVEDNPDMQDYIKSLLTDHYNIYLADHGLEALSILKSTHVDLIISDVMMPEMDGFALLRELKGQDSYRIIPVIMLTSLTEQEDRLNALTIGVDDYLTKPFVTTELRARVKNLLRNYRLRQKASQTENEETLDIGLPDNLMTALDAKTTSVNELAWIKKVEQVALMRLTDNDFSMETLAESFDIGTRQLQRKVKQITGLRPNQYVQELRLQLSRSYLEKKAYPTVNAISHNVGFQSTQYFSKLFKERFGKNPSEYLS